MELLNANAVGWVYVKKKFPHAYRDSTISEAVSQKNFCLKKDECCKFILRNAMPTITKFRPRYLALRFNIVTL